MPPVQRVSKHPRETGMATTLEAVAAELGVTKQRVQQIERQALQKLRSECEQRGISRDVVLEHLADQDRRSQTQFVGDTWWLSTTQHDVDEQPQDTAYCVSDQSE